MGGDSSSRNQRLYCHYHKDRGHTTEDCRTLQDHLSQLVKAGKLNRFLHQPAEQFSHPGAKFSRDSTPRPALGTINVIFAKPEGNVGPGIRVMSVGEGCDLKYNAQSSKKARGTITPTLGFSEEDKEGTIQPHDDALVVTIRIRVIT
ncbi:uncharacterized protein LOC142606249 [Castanea sativa]|uniref:uncharacterized protein LOC142606249 n=1 Tax=Castanea sativa TaxID=21020 RepID=UPI003F6521DA